MKAADKAGRLSAHDDDVSEIVDYYEQHGDRQLLPMAYYYAGRSAFVMQDAQKALDYFQKSARIAADDHELQKTIYCNMGYVYLWKERFGEAYNSFKLQHELGKSSHDTLTQIQTLETMSVCLAAMGKREAAVVMADDAGYLSRHFSNQDMLSHIWTDEFGKFNNEQLQMRALTIFRPLFFSLQPDVKLLTKPRLAGTYNSSADTAYWGNYPKENNLIVEARRAARTAISNFMGNNPLREAENNRLKTSNMNKTIALIVVAALFIVLLLYALMLLWRYRQEKRMLSARYMLLEHLQVEEYERSQAFIDANKARLADLEKRLQTVSSENEQLRLQLECERERLLSSNVIAEMGMREQEDIDRSVMQSPVYQKFTDTADHQSDEKLTADDWQRLKQLLDREYDGFTKRLKSLVRLSLQKYRMCMLIKIRLQPVKIARLLHTDDSTIGSRRIRLYRKYFGDGKAKDWDRFILSL